MNLQIAWRQNQAVQYTQHLKPNTKDAGPYMSGSFIITSYTMLFHHYHRQATDWATEVICCFSFDLKHLSTKLSNYKW